MNKKTQVPKILSREEVKQICIESQREGLPKSGLGASVRSGFSEKLSGQTLYFKFDDFDDLAYKVISGEAISWSDSQGIFQDEYAQILELETAHDLFLINHLRRGTFPLINITLIIDMRTKLVTLIRAVLGDSIRSRDVERTFHFGYLDQKGNNDVSERHEFTTDLVGKIIEWHYDHENKFVAQHLYLNNEHMAYLLLETEDDAKGLCEAAECDYIKIRDNVYIMSWLEKCNQGMQGVTLIDIDALHDVGSFFGVNIISNKLECYTFAAWGKWSEVGRQII